jgi:hypothetical protein
LDLASSGDGAVSNWLMRSEAKCERDRETRAYSLRRDRGNRTERTRVE